MKVLEHGNPNEWEIEKKCTGAGNGGGGCGIRLLVNKDDIFITADYNFDADLEYYYTFKCPKCGVLTDIPACSLPSTIRKKDITSYIPKIHG